MRNRQERYMGMDEDELYRIKMERSSRRISPRKDEEEEILDLGAEGEEEILDLGAEDAEDWYMGTPETENQDLTQMETAAAQERYGYIRQDSRQPDIHKYVYIQIVIDGTYSFSTLFAAVYRTLEHFTEHLKREIRKYEGVHFFFGGMVIGDTTSQITFREEEFTENPDEFLNGIRKIEFTGGSDSGYENINDAIENAVRSLENNSPKRANRGLLMFTDSRPEETGEFSFQNIPGCPNHGLRFETLFMKEPQYYVPLFRNVDGAGLPENNQKNGTHLYDIKRILKDGDRLIETVVDEILRQSSIHC